jgi:hypothetical protein
MTNVELKYDLMRLIMDLEDTQMLQNLKKMLAKPQREEKVSDVSHGLTDHQKQQLELGKLQLQTGQYATYDEVKNDVKALFERKLKERDNNG